MVLGLRTKNRKSPTVRLDYLIHIVEIKPWPPSQSLRLLRSALIQWEHGDKNSGSTKAVAPSLVSGSGVGDGKIEFNESFRLHMILSREMSIKSGESDNFLKNCIEFNMYEPRWDKTVKGQLLATATLDFAEYGIIRESLTISVPMNCKRTYGNTSQPMLFVKIQAVEKNNRVRSLSRDSLVREGSMERNCSESVSALMSEEYAEEAETASVTDDDVSSQSSMAAAASTLGSNGSSTPQRANESEAINGCSGKAKDQEVLLVEYNREAQTVAEANATPKDSSRSSSLTNLSSEPVAEELSTNLRSNAYGNVHEKILKKASISRNDLENIVQESTSHRLSVKGAILTADHKVDEKLGSIEAVESQACEVDVEKSWRTATNVDQNHSEQESHIKADLGCNIIKNMKSVRSPVDSANGSIKTGKFVEKVKDVGIHAQSSGRSLMSNERKDVSKVQHLEHRVRMLESELRESAAIEVGLYSVVAEHGSSTNKVHAPARRLSRLYLHACKENSKSSKASSARSVVSGLILVAKACGNDVPRLTYWLSNSVALRAIIHKAFEEEQAGLPGRPSSRKNVKKGNNEMMYPLKWKESSSKENKSGLGSSNEWDDPRTFTSALEKVESWIFSRIIESVWWQTLTPYMQSAAAKAIVRVVDSECSRACRRTSNSCDQEQAEFSLELWKTAFMDACERICPVRAEGHDCGCLPMLSRLVMEQCVARLDVAMFNAILRESADEVPTDPIADPISDARVLPIPSGKASFGAGAQLKNTIGNWSRWLTDLFGIDDDDSFEDENEPDKNNSSRKDDDASCKCFHLLNALSDLMMLPKDMLLSNTIRKEVCPTFGAPLIKRMLATFIPDEFCPDPIPKVVLEALNSEDSFESGEDSVMSLPCAAAPVVYHPPSASLIGRIFGDGGSQTHLSRCGSSILRKSNTSDDELDELDSPLTSVIGTPRSAAPSRNPRWTLKDNGYQNSTIRYQLLREVWMNSE